MGLVSQNEYSCAGLQVLDFTGTNAQTKYWHDVPNWSKAEAQSFLTEEALRGSTENSSLF